MSINKISVIGGGLMGHGIALIMADSHPVSVYEVDENSRVSFFGRVADSLTALNTLDEKKQRILSNISISGVLGESLDDTDLVIEAAPENLALKQKIFAEVEALVSVDCLLASNTSVIPITQIMEKLKHRERALGTHWWNPPHIIPLVEVINTQWTNEDTTSAVFNVLNKVGKKPVVVKKDIPGFIGNRLQHALWREAISLVENGVCSAEAVDDVVKASFGRRLAVLGPIENADLVGIELTQAIHEQILPSLDASAEPSPLLKELLANGRSGMAAGAGFRDWDENAKPDMSAKLAVYLEKLEGILKS